MVYEKHIMRNHKELQEFANIPNIFMNLANLGFDSWLKIRHIKENSGGGGGFSLLRISYSPFQFFG